MLSKWSWIVDFNIIAYVLFIAEPMVIRIWGECFSHISLVHRRVLSVILTSGFGMGKLRFNRTWSNQFICHQSYTTFTFCIYGRGYLSAFFPAYNLYFHLPNVITSGMSIFISINFTIIETFIPLYPSIINVRDYLLPTLLHPTKKSETCRINISTTMIGS